MRDFQKLLIGLAVLGALSPLGLLASGHGWGEWGAEAVRRMIGFLPEGLERFSHLWRAPFADYRVGGTGDAVGYLVSAFGGMVLVMLAAWVVGRLLARRDKKNADDRTP